MARKKLPLDVKKLLESANMLGAQRDLPVAVDIVYDASAPDALIHCITEAFATSAPNAVVEEAVLGTEVPNVSVPADLCVIVAGTSPLVAQASIAVRGRGVPTVVVALEGQKGYAGSIVGVRRDKAGGAPMEGIPTQDFIEIDPQDRTGRPLEELGVWVVENIKEKRLSMASSFEFCRHPVAGEVAVSNSIQNGAIGTVFFMPGADMPLITLNQARMVLEIASVYGQPLDKQRIKELAVVVAGAYGMRGIARQLARQVPGPLGVPLKAAIAFAGTLGMGYAAIDYFEQGRVVSSVVDGATNVYGKVDGHVRVALKSLAAHAGRIGEAASAFAAGKTAAEAA